LSTNILAAISVRQVSKKFGHIKAVESVDLRVEPGEFFGLLGPNGAGKTTLINIIAGLCLADGGRVEVMGHDVVKDYQSARRALGVVPQELVFDPFFSVRETLRFQSGYFGIKDNDEWIDEILANLNLVDKADANMRSLSGGMKRRVLVAQALVHRPPVIILDEPTAGVDVDLRRGLWDFIQKLNNQGHTIVLTTHYLEEAESLCNRVAMLKAGEIVLVEETTKLLRRQKEPFLRVRLKGEVSYEIRSSDYARVISASDGGYLIKLSGLSEVENVLRDLRESGCEIDKMEIEQEDLEDVFLSIMADNKSL